MSKVLNIVIGLGIVIILMPIIFSIFDLPSIGLPNGVYEFLTQGAIAKVCATFYYFLPINFILGCILIIFLSRQLGIVWGMINYIIKKVVGQ